MIRKEGAGWVVLSEEGKRLSRVLKTHGEAVKRLAQVEYFKNKGGKK